MDFFERVRRGAHNRFMDPEIDETTRIRILVRKMEKEMHTVPFIGFDFFKPHTDISFTIPEPDREGDSWRTGICLEIQPLATALRVTIRPDISKEEATRILTKIIKKISKDRTSWWRKVSNYIATLK